MCVFMRMSVCKTCYGIYDELSDSSVCVNDRIHLIHRNQQIYPKETSKQDSVSLLWYLCLKMLSMCRGRLVCVLVSLVHMNLIRNSYTKTSTYENSRTHMIKSNIIRNECHSIIMNRFAYFWADYSQWKFNLVGI